MNIDGSWRTSLLLLHTKMLLSLCSFFSENFVKLHVFAPLLEGCPSNENPLSGSWRSAPQFLSVVTLLQAEVSEEDLPRFDGMPCVLSDGSRHHGDEKTKRGFCYIPPVRYPDGKCPFTMETTGLENRTRHTACSIICRRGRIPVLA